MIYLIAAGLCGSCWVGCICITVDAYNHDYENSGTLLAISCIPMASTIFNLWAYYQ